MHIFMTNDDGFESPGLVETAKKLASLGRVTVIAPNRGRSSCSSSLSLQTYLRMWHKPGYGENISVLSCNGTTADCCKLGLEHWLRNDPPDLIVSGINNGFNSGSDCLYSGTVAGAMEGTFLGIPSIALSAETVKEPEYLAQCVDFAYEVIRTYFVEKKYKGILNLNIPRDHISWGDLKVAGLGIQRYQNVIREMKDPSGHLGFWLSGKMLPDAMPDTDVYWIHRGYPTLTALTWNQTDTARLEKVREIAAEQKKK